MGVDLVPVFIPVRDRLTPLLELINWLTDHGLNEIYLIDNLSTYVPMQRFLSFTPYHVVLTGKNLGHRSPWLSGTVQRFAKGREYIVTDPDVIPDDRCPTDAVHHLSYLLKAYPEAVKVGLGLRIDDLPEHNPMRSQICDWERQFWLTEIEPGVFDADVDTTFALYRPYNGRQQHSPCLRTGFPYVARHLPWYKDPSDLTEEDLYYRNHANQVVSNWERDLVPQWKSLVSKR